MLIWIAFTSIMQQRLGRSLEAMIKAMVDFNANVGANPAVQATGFQ